MRRILHAGLVLAFGCTSVLTGAPPDNGSVRLPISEATDLLFISVSFEQGPAHSRVGQIVEGSAGFLWFGTKDGLKRYDGYGFREFRPDLKDRNSLSGVFINALFKDRSGKLWVAADENLDRYDPSTEKFTHYPSIPGRLDGPVNDINQDRNGIIWLATSHGLSRLDSTTETITRFQHDPNDPSSLTSDFLRSTFEENDGTFWVATNQGLDVFDRGTGKVTQHFSLSNPLRATATSTNETVRLFKDRSGVLWVAAARDGLAMVDRKNNKLMFFALDPGTDPRLQPGAYAIYEDRHGTLWIGTNGGGLLTLDRNRARFVRYRNNPNDLDSLSSDQVLAFFEDHEDGIWLGTGGGGVLRVPGQAQRFQRYRHKAGNPNSLITDYVSSVFEDSHGMLWVGSKGAVTRIDRATGQFTHHSLQAGEGSQSDVTSITEDSSGHLWFATRGEGIIRFDPQTGSSKTYRHDPAKPRSLSHDAVFALFIDHRGIMWTATEDGLDAFDPATDDFRVYKAPGVSPNRERAIAEDATGMLWLATWYSGVHRFDPVTGQFTIYRHSEVSGSLSNDAVAAIAVDHSGIVWAGTQQGLNRFDPATQVFTAYYDRDGLPNNNVDGILEDGQGDLWITTDNGLSNFNRRLNAFKNYFRSDGLPGDFTTAWRSPAGEMFFASFNGVTAVSADAEVEIPYVPPVVLTAFHLFDKPAPISIDSPLKQSISVTKHLTLSHAQNILSFEFAALSYANPERTRYRYRLDGLESDWTEVDSNQRFARYTSLAPGNYVFRVQSRTSRATWSDKEAEVGILILPPWWSTWWFRTVCALAALMMLWFAYRFRVQQLAAQLNLRFEERLAERTRIARDLHDTLLQGFLSVSMQLNVAVDSVPADSPARPLLNRALQAMGKVIDEGRNVLRGLRSSGSVSMDLEQAFSRIPDELGVREPIDFRVIVEGHPRSLHPTLRDEAYRIGREALVNAFCHSRASSIEIELHYAARQLRIVVRDNGCGIDLESLRQGREGHWGLRGMRERAESIGGRITVWSRPAAGTEVELSIPGRIAFQNFRRSDSRRWFIRLADQKAREDTGKENCV